MSPEQEEFLARKCEKRELHRADLMMYAIGSSFSSKAQRPSDVLDMMESPPEPSDRKAAREKRYGKWFKQGQSEQELYEWLVAGNYEVARYFDDREIEAFQRIKEANNDDSK